MLTIAGHPILALFAAMAAGMLSGYVTAFLQTRLGVESILAGIISNTGLYTINLAVMGFFVQRVHHRGVDTVFSLFKGLVGGQWSRLDPARTYCSRDRVRAHPLFRHILGPVHPRHGR